MARPGVGYEDVKQAAVTLLTRGQNPSVQRIRDLLGTGSNTTISEHLRRWQQALAASPKATLPDAVPKDIMPAVETFWLFAVEHAEAAYQALKDEAREQVRDAVEQLASTHREVDILRRQLEDARTNIDTMQQQLVDEQDKRRVAEQATIAAQTRMEAIQTAANRFREETERHSRQLHAQLEQTQHAAAQAAEEADARLNYERERGEANEARLMGILDQIRTEHGRQQRELLGERQAWQQRENALHQQLESLRQTGNALQNSNAVLAAQSQRLGEELADVCGKLAQVETAQLKRARLTESLRKELSASVLENRALSKALGNCRRILAKQPISPVRHAPKTDLD